MLKTNSPCVWKSVIHTMISYTSLVKISTRRKILRYKFGPLTDVKHMFDQILQGAMESRPVGPHKSLSFNTRYFFLNLQPCYNQGALTKLLLCEGGLD